MQIFLYFIKQPKTVSLGQWLYIFLYVEGFLAKELHLIVFYENCEEKCIENGL